MQCQWWRVFVVFALAFAGVVVVGLVVSAASLSAPVSYGEPDSVTVGGASMLNPDPGSCPYGYDQCTYGMFDFIASPSGWLAFEYVGVGPVSEPITVAYYVECPGAGVITWELRSAVGAIDSGTASSGPVYEFDGVLSSYADADQFFTLTLAYDQMGYCFTGMNYPYYVELDPIPTALPAPDRVSWLWATDNVSGTGSLTLNWDDVGADSYDVYRDGRRIVTDTVVTSVPDSGLTGGVGYVYQVVSKDSGGGSTPGVSLVIVQGEGDTSPIMPSVSMAATTQALYEVGLLPAVTLAAVVSIAALLYVRFRR